MLKSLGKRPKVIIVSKIDRFARSLSDLLKTLEFLEQNGIGFVGVNDSGIDTTTPNGRLLLQILGAFPEFERNMINYRIKAGRVISLFFMVNSLKELLGTPQKVMLTQAVAKRYVELKEILKEIQPESIRMLPDIDPDKVTIEELRIGFEMMFASCIPFIVDYSKTFEDLLNMVHTFVPSNV